MTNQSIEILDVTLRDGEQTTGVSFSKSEKLNITKFLLLNVRVNRVEVASARVSRGELEIVQNIINWAKTEKLENQIEILGFVDGNKTVEWMIEAGVKNLNLLIKGSKNHLEKQLKKTIQEHITDITFVINNAVKQGITTSVYLEDWSNGFRHSPKYVLDLVKNLSIMNIKRIYLADTLGVLSPDETYEGVYTLSQAFPDLHFEFHGHNDYDLSVANCLSALKAGIKGIHVSVNGLGERAGNSPLEAVVTSIHDKTNFRTSVDEKYITEASKLVEIFSGKRISANRPIVGEDVFTQTAGVHADGDQKGNLYANPILPERFGRKRSYALGKLSGKANISENLKQLGLVLSPDIEKKVLERVVELGDQNKIVSKEDLPFIIADIAGTRPEDFVKIQKCKIVSGIGLKPFAEIQIVLFKNEYIEKGEGDGGYDAFMNALAKILKKANVEIPDLADYEVRIPPGGKTDALVETIITWRFPDSKNIRTIGVDSDQVNAAILATEKMLNIIISSLKTDG